MIEAIIFAAAFGAVAGVWGGLWYGRKATLADARAEMDRAWRDPKWIDEALANLEAQRDDLRFNRADAEDERGRRGRRESREVRR